MRVHQVPLWIVYRRGTFTLKCDVSGGLTLGRAQEMTLKETILGPINWGNSPRKDA